MATTKRIICCCEAGKWSLVFAWLQIVLCSLAAAWFLMFIVGVSVAEVAKGKEEDRLLALVFFSVMLFTSTVGIVLGIILLFGTKKEKPELLWTWIVVTAIITSFVVLSSIFHALKGEMSDVIEGLVCAVISSFMMYVVHRRIVDIQDSRFISPRPYTSVS